jgi:hypothetical protein
MKKTALAVIPMLAFLALLVVPASYAAGQSQIVLSCTTAAPHAGTHPAHPCVSSELATSPPICSPDPTCASGTLYFIGGFWIWCQNPNGGTPYGPDCKGSVYIEEIDLSTGAGKYEATSISGGATPGIWVTFTSSDGDMSCTLLVTSGSSTLSGNCDAGAGPIPITFTNANVHVT